MVRIVHFTFRSDPLRLPSNLGWLEPLIGHYTFVFGSLDIGQRLKYLIMIPWRGLGRADLLAWDLIGHCTFVLGGLSGGMATIMTVPGSSMGSGPSKSASALYKVLETCSSCDNGAFTLWTSVKRVVVIV